MMFKLVAVFIFLLLRGQSCKANSIRGAAKDGISDKPVDDIGKTLANNNLRQLRSSTGVQTVLVVLVSSSAGEKDSTLNATYLQGVIFGTGMFAQSANLISQYKGCSHNVLQLKPATSGTNVKNGVLELQISGKIAGGNVEGSLQTKILDATKASLQMSGIRAAANHIMFCLPKGSLSGGTANWVSFSHTGGSISWYQNGACAMLSPIMHEMGHNLGFFHSGLGSDTYGDTSGYMGYAYRTTGAPQMCFNAHKNWISGWFDDRKLTVDPSIGGAWSGNLTAFVDYSASTAKRGALHIINVGDLYIQLNSAKKFNMGTHANRNQVAIVRASSSHDLSWFAASLSAGQLYTYSRGGVVVHVCSIQFGASDYAQLSIHLNDGVQTSTC